MKNKSVYAKSADGIGREVFESAAEAGQMFGVGPDAISKAVRKHKMILGKWYVSYTPFRTSGPNRQTDRQTSKHRDQIIGPAVLLALIGPDVMEAQF